MCAQGVELQIKRKAKLKPHVYLLASLHLSETSAEEGLGYELSLNCTGITEGTWGGGNVWA